MVSKYIVLQYGNMITGEYLNIGVYTYDIDEDKPQVYCKFLQNWRRVNALFGGSGDVCNDGILKGLLENFFSKIATKADLQNAIEEVSSPYNSVLFIAPRASLGPAEILLEDLAKQFLVE